MTAAGSKRLTLAKNALDVVLRRLSALPHSPEVEDLRRRTGDCLRLVDGWTLNPPTPEQREAVMQLVLNLHIATAKLERRAASRSAP